MFLYIFGFVFSLGAVVGSFLNVCIYRIPAGQSVVSPRSHCPSCRTTLCWYQNIPVVSYLFLAGRCASCHCRVSPRYPLIEILTGLIFSLVFFRVGFHWSVVVYWLFVSSLVVVAFIDFDHQIIPDVISLPGIVIGVIFSMLVPWLSLVDSLLGVVVGGGSLFLIGLGYEVVTKREGMGGGDVKLLAMIGAFMGWQSILPIVFLSAVIGTLVGVPVMMKSKANTQFAIPYGPFLVMATFLYIFRGREIIQWYLSSLGGP